MNHKNIKFPPVSLLFVLLLVISSCNPQPKPTIPLLETPPAETSVSTEIQTPSPTLVPPRVLTICMAGEPGTLFLYGDSSIAARGVRAAIYDGPLDYRDFKATAVILERVPSLANGDARLEAVEVQPGSRVVNDSGGLANLEDGTIYRPEGCSDSTCAQTYNGQDPVSMNQFVVRFKLIPGLLWSDGSPLTADDSLYSFEVARSLNPIARPDLIEHTASYQVVDDTTIEWRGVPGYLDENYPANFFTPLPRHVWGDLSPQELLTADISARTPMGWGPYQIDEWTAGDHISLSRNTVYFRSNKGLPNYDKLVFRFVTSGVDAVAALLAGECDLIDESVDLQAQSAQLLQLNEEGRIAVNFETGTAWEHADFGIESLDPDQPALFQSKETRQAIAMCIDRQRMVDELFSGKSQVLNTFTSPTHPFYDSEARHYDFDPQSASQLLQSAGWLDLDQDVKTPRTAQGVPGVLDGTPFEFTYLTTDEPEKQQVSQIVQESLAQCGIKVTIRTGKSDQLFAPGPGGPVFGRKFSMAQFAWITTLQPPCFLFTTSQIPGPYPEYLNGWGGANATGYSNPEYDQACHQAMSTLPDSPEHADAYRRAQEIFAEDLPVIPLYLRVRLIAMRPDLCGVIPDPSAETINWNIEAFNDGEGCKR